MYICNILPAKYDHMHSFLRLLWPLVLEFWMLFGVLIHLCSAIATADSKFSTNK